MEGGVLECEEAYGEMAWSGLTGWCPAGEERQGGGGTDAFGAGWWGAAVGLAALEHRLLAPSVKPSTLL